MTARVPEPVTVRVCDEKGVIRFAIILEDEGTRVKVRDTTGRERWIERVEIMEAE